MLVNVFGQVDLFSASMHTLLLLSNDDGSAIAYLDDIDLVPGLLFSCEGPLPNHHSNLRLILHFILCFE